MSQKAAMEHEKKMKLEKLCNINTKQNTHIYSAMTIRNLNTLKKISFLIMAFIGMVKKCINYLKLFDTKKN